MDGWLLTFDLRMNRSYSIIAAKLTSKEDLATSLCLAPTSEANTLGGICHGDQAIDSIFAIGFKERTALALMPGLREESEQFYSLLSSDRTVGLFTSEFDTCSASVSILMDLAPGQNGLIREANS